MNDEVDYSVEDLEKLVAEALGEINLSGPRGLFSYGDTQLLERLSKILPNYVQHHADVQVILDELRDALYLGNALTDDKETSIRNLHTMVQHCRRCPLMKPDPKLPQWNLADPDVVFVTETPLTGSEGDKLFFSTLKKVGFRSSRIAATSVVRCFPEERRGPNSEEIVNCTTRYLFNELQLFRPKLIVAIGGIPSAVLLGQQVKITQERGRQFWVGPWPILVTLSPSFALRSAKNTTDFESDLAQSYQFVYGR